MRAKLDNMKLQDLVKTFRVNEMDFEAFSFLCIGNGLDPSKALRFFMKKVINKEIVLDGPEVRSYLDLKQRKITQ